MTTPIQPAEPVAEPVPGPDMEDRILDRLGVLIFSSRLGLIPMYVLLWVALIAYNVHYAQELFGFLATYDWSKPFWEAVAFKENDSTDYLLWILDLIDMGMIANLVVMITVGGYSTFVKEYKLDSIYGKPRWMNGLDSTALKNKMGMSLIGVSAIHLLKTFMEIGQRFHVLLEEIRQGTAVDPVMQIILQSSGAGLLIIIHLVFIHTTLSYARNAQLMHSHRPRPMAEPTAH